VYAGRVLSLAVAVLVLTAAVGHVTLPGAYVGPLLSGATPLAAGRVQLLVLVGLLAAETAAVVVSAQLLAPRPGRHRPSGLTG
jgi:putative ABC transport system permease protein